MAEEVIKSHKRNQRIIKNLVLIAIVIGLGVVPLVIAKDAEFAGADDKAEKAITEIDANYEAWFSPVWEPPSGEIESLIFALQAAIGSGIVAYGLGYLRGRKKGEEASRK